jgi:hypothetical protein
MDRTGMPDPLRSHGAWITLCVSTAVGTLSVERGFVELGLLAGTAFAGGFLALAAVSAGISRHRKRASLGLVLTGLSTAAALALGAPSSFLVALVAAAACGGLGLALARRRGILDPLTLAASLAPFTLAASGAALALGATPTHALTLFLALWLFACWRSLLVARTLHADAAWDRMTLRARGLREAAWSALWGIGLVLVA